MQFLFKEKIFSLSQEYASIRLAHVWTYDTMELKEPATKQMSGITGDHLTLMYLE